MKKRLFSLIICMFLLCGCWDRVELPQLGIVAAIAIDKDPNTGEFIFTSQLIKPLAESAQTPSPGSPIHMETTTGKTVFEAIREANQGLERKGFYAHNKVIIISEEIARDGLIPVLDTFKRGKEVRGYVWLCIAKDTEAKKILEMQSKGISRIPATYLKNLIENTRYHLDSTSINLLKYYKKTLGAGIDPVAGVLIIDDKKINGKEKTVKYTGGAVFKKDKLAGFLNEIETRGYRWITGEIESGAIALPSLLNEDKYVTVEVTKMSAKIKPEVKGDEISFTIDVTEEGRLMEQQSTGEFEDRKQKKDYLEKLEEENKKIIEEEIEKALEKAKKKLQADIFGFGRALNKEYPKTWNKVKDNWSEVYADASYTVNVNVNIKSSGLMQGPFKPEE